MLAPTWVRVHLERDLSGVEKTLRAGVVNTSRQSLASIEYWENGDLRPAKYDESSLLHSSLKQARQDGTLDMIHNADQPLGFDMRISGDPESNGVKIRVWDARRFEALLNGECPDEGAVIRTFDVVTVYGRGKVRMSGGSSRVYFRDYLYYLIARQEPDRFDNPEWFEDCETQLSRFL